MREWDEKLAPAARKIAAAVIAESGLEADRPAIERGDWDGDDHVIIAMRALMSTRPAPDTVAGHPEIQIVCAACGTHNVGRDAYVDWDTDTQSWVRGAIFDDGHCQVCAGESRLEEVPLDEWIEQREDDEIYPREPNLTVGAMFDELSKWFAVVKETDTGEIIWTGDLCSDPRDAKDAARLAIIQGIIE